MRQRRARPARDDRAAARRALPVSVTAPAGLRRRRGLRRDQGGRPSTSPSSPPPTAGPSRPPASSPPTWRRRRRCRSAGPTSPPPAAGRPGSSSPRATPTPPRAPGPRAAERLCARGGRGHRRDGRGDPRLPDRAHRHPVPDRRRRCRRSRRIVMARTGGPEAAPQAARAIMTTDTVPKEVVVAGHGFTVGGMAKGAAMLAPNMATMLAVLTTDAAVDAGHAAEGAARRRWPRRSTPSRSTAARRPTTPCSCWPAGSGRAPSPGRAHRRPHRGLPVAGRADGGRRGGGHQGRARHVRGAASDEAAHVAARKVADSMLVQCSLFGEDPYWGRIVSELGSAGTPFDIDRVSVAYGGTVVCAAGVAVAHDEAAVAAHMAGRHVEIDCDLGLGAGAGRRARDRPRLRLHRREQDDVVTAPEAPARAAQGDPGPAGGGGEDGLGARRGAAVHPALLGQDRRRQVRRQRAARGGRGRRRRAGDALASFAAGRGAHAGGRACCPSSCTAAAPRSAS